MTGAAPAAAFDAEAVRAAELPALGEGIYLNAAGYGPLPARTLKAMEAFQRRRHEGRVGAADFAPALDGARAAAARLIGARPEEVALTPNTNVGLNLAADIAAARRATGGHNPERRRGVLLSDREFPANVYPWLSLEREGMRVERLATDALGRPREDALLERLHGDDVAVFTISAVQFATGHRASLAAFGRVCSERGILFVVDAIQQVGARPLDVRGAQVDVLACGAQKWLCSPWGSGFAYVRPELAREVEPRRPGWLSFQGSLDFERLVDYDPELLDDGRRFEVGSLGVQDHLGMARSIELLLELGPEAVWAHIQAVQAPLLAWAEGREDVTLVSDASPAHRSGIVCLRPANPARAYAALERAGVTCALREGALRFAPHFYNTVEEMERVVGILDGVAS
ncbi:MAG TPA: aminotransferase class V-fold PLP-dependent enzyme [Longimicrobiales bacterium]|nr:aminotransferase class V-fold PLP-dependent enzyme [Longimicrobiales bacterium]